MVQYTLSISAVTLCGVNGKMLYIVKMSEIPVSDETYRGVVMEDDIVIEVRLGICILAQFLQFPVLL